MIDWDAFQSYGWSFLPVTWRGKNPAIEAWKHLQTQHPTAEEVGKWKRRRRSNVGIVTGAISGFFALDIDSDEAQATVDALGMPPTMTVRTRNGRHYYFKHPGFPVSNKVKILGGKIDVRGDGGYVVGPGSVHEDDHTFEYEWEDPSPIAEAPQWLIDEIKPKPPAPRPAAPQSNGHDEGNERYVQASLDELRAELAATTKGERNNALFKKGARMFEFVAAHAASESYVRSELLTLALAVGLDERSSLKTIDSAAKRGLKKPAQIPESTKPKQANTVRNSGGGISAAALQRLTFPEVQFVVPKIFVEGLTLLAGRPKRGKSWLGLDCCAAVALGGYALGNIKCDEAGDTLALMLEDNRRRIHARLNQLLTGEQWPERLTFHTMEDGWPRLDEGGLQKMEEWITSVARPRLILVDVLQCVRAKANSKNTPYGDDYSALKGLQELAGNHRIAIVAVHHTRKAKSDDDVFDEISGTTGLVGAVDTAVVMQRGEGRADFLVGRGRDVRDFEYAIKLDQVTGQWRLLGDADAYRGNEAEKKIIATLTDSAEEMGPREIADAINGSYQATKQRLYAMAKAGTIRKIGRGKYATL